MSFDDILVFRSGVISKLFCVRGNCYGNFNGQTTGGVTSTLKVAGDLKLFINDCNVFLARNYHCIERRSTLACVQNLSFRDAIYMGRIF